MESLTSSFSNYLTILMSFDGITRETVILCLLMIFNPLTYDLRSRILGRKREQARAAFEPLARLV